MAMSSRLFLCWHRAARLFELAHGSKALLGFLWWYRVEGFFVISQSSMVLWFGTQQQGFLC